MKSTVLIVAAGRGSRFGGDRPKQYRDLVGKPVLRHCIEALLSVSDVDTVRVVIGAADLEEYRRATRAITDARLGEPIVGGATRQESVRLGLEALAAAPPDAVLVHDAARPLIDEATVQRILEALRTAPAAIAAIPVVDTLKRAGPGAALVEATPSRENLWRAQTPQGFHFAPILDAHRRAASAGRSVFTDDAEIAEWAGLPVALVMGAERNFKLTTEADMVRAAKELDMSSSEVRTGSGFDVHRFAPGDHVWLCGVRIPHSHTLEGHSDADVALHALTDAILGALGDGDIGQHFPPSEPRWKGAASRVFLEDAARRVAGRSGTVTNVDVTLLCEAPRVGPHRDAMRAAIAEILGISVDRVGVKATTTEGLGFTGRREGIAAMATATLLLACPTATQ
ncbi:MAG: bifunctional 2-C-methyl-D-erythritol 4-phosphate cytidylyltransferase/2-C-methyl-D-erythritol 2,4-cyclodiphosphate synthase [Hyphomicrobium sp.]